MYTPDIIEENGGRQPKVDGCERKGAREGCDGRGVTRIEKVA